MGEIGHDDFFVTDESISHKNGSIFVCYKSYFGLKKSGIFCIWACWHRTPQFL